MVQVKLENKKKIGILGGTFDPAHKGHIKISLEAKKRYGINKIIWAITKKNPYKSKSEYSLNERIKFAKKINAIDEQLVNIMSGIPASETSFITFHPAWGYFAADYGLHQLPIQVEGKEADMKHLQKLIDYAKKENIKVIFMEPQFSKKQAKVIANAIGGKVIAIDPLAEDWGKNLVSIAETFKATMK